MGEKHADAARTNGAVVLKRSEHILSRRNIDPDALRILFRLHSLGFTAYLTGGAVRDMLLGKTPKDFDIVTDARPGQIKKYFPNVFIIGRRFRLAHVHCRGGKIIEVATFRKDADAGPPDNPELTNFPVTLYGTPREDAFRRDITINALFYDPASASIIDFVGGIEDLRLRRVRIIGDAAKRFTEDAVRIWRVIRYAARLGFQIDPGTENEIPLHSHLLAQCSGARLYEEFQKDLIQKGTRSVVAGLWKYGVLSCLLGRAGAAYEKDPVAFARLGQLLDSVEPAKAKASKPLLDEMSTLFFWPWLEPLFTDSQADMHGMLKKEFNDAGMAVILPKNLRAQVIEFMVLVGKMIQALRTGHARGSWRGRPHYVLAARLCFLFVTGRAPAAEESFESLFKQAFPQIPASGMGRRRRRRRKKPALH